MIIYSVIDTNVIVSAFLKENSIPAQVLRYALNGPIIPLVNVEILLEYEDVLLRNKFGFDKESIEAFIDEYSKRAIFLDRTKTDELFDDLDDVVFYEVVLTARKETEAFLVTGNKRHYPVKHFVVTPSEMLNIINNNIACKNENKN